MDEIQLQIKLDIPNLNNRYRSSDDCPELFDATLQIKDEQPKIICLKIYFERSTLFHYKLMAVKDKKGDSFFFGKVMTINKIITDENIKNVSFLNSQWKTIEGGDGDSYTENNKQYLKVFFDSAEITYNSTNQDNVGQWLAEFYLNKASEAILDDFYHYDPFWSNESVYKAKHNYNQFVSFGEIQFKLEYRFYTENLNDTTVIHKEPKLTIKHQNLGQDKLLSYAKLICSILSIYRNESIDYIIGKIYNSETKHVHTKIVPNVKLSKSKGLKKRGFPYSVLSILEFTNISKIWDEIELFSKLSDHYILAQKLQGESKFMILYNLMEQIRNIYSHLDETQEEFKFKFGKKKINKLIRDKLREIADYVEDEEKEAFLEHVITHCNTIKYRPMNKQFDFLLNHFEIDLVQIDLNFRDLLDIRNLIYHGTSVSPNDTQLKKANRKFPDLVCELLIKMLGVKPIKKAKKEEPKPIIDNLPFSINEIPNNEFDISESEGDNTVLAVKKEQSKTPWLYDEIVVKYKKDEPDCKKIHLIKYLTKEQISLAMSCVNWIYYMYGNQRYFAIGSQDRSDFIASIEKNKLYWKGYEWTGNKYELDCKIYLEDDAKKLVTLFTINNFKKQI